MAEKLLVNVTVDETRVALVEGGVLSNLEIDTRSLVHAKGNVYKGVVHRVNPSLQAAFVDYGADKQGFLPLSEIHDRYYPTGVRGKRVPIQEVLREGQELMVQVVKDEIGNKGAAAIAKGLEDNGSLTALGLGGNRLNESAKAALRAAARPTLKLEL